MRKSQQAGLQFLESEVAADDLVAVATISARGGIRLLCPFSPDRNQAIRAISTFDLGEQIKYRDPAGFGFDAELRQAEEELKKLEESGDSDPATEQLVQILRMSSESAKQSYAGVVVNYAGMLDILSAALNGLRGRKNVILFSEGFDQDALTGQDLEALSRQSEAWQTLNVNSSTALSDTGARASSHATLNDVQQVLQRLSHGNAVFYAIDIGRFAGEGGASEVFGSNEDSKRRSGQAALLQFADETNGRLYANLSRLETAMEDIGKRTSCAYVITFRPSRKGNPGEFREISVRVKRPGLSVEHQRGYTLDKPYSDFTPAERQLQLAEFVVKDIPGGRIHFQADAVPFDGNALYARLPVIVEIDGDTVISPPGERKQNNVSLEIYGYLLGEHNAPVDYFFDQINLPRSEAAKQLTGNIVKYYGLLTAQPGSYKLKCIVRDSELGMISTRISQVEIPDYVMGGLHVSGPVFIEMRRDLISVFNNMALQATGRRQGHPVDYPYQWGERTLTPAIDPPCTPQMPEVVFLRIHGVRIAGGVPQVDLKFEAIAEDGTAKPVDPVALVDSRADEDAGVLSVVLQFGLGGLLPEPGQYRLRATITDKSLRCRRRCRGAVSDSRVGRDAGGIRQARMPAPLQLIILILVGRTYLSAIALRAMK